MNLHSFIASNGLRIETEPKEITVRVFDEDDNHLFNCQVTAAGLDTARITAGSIVNGEHFDLSVYKALDEYLVHQGFEYGVLERMNDTNGFKVTHRKLKSCV